MPRVFLREHGIYAGLLRGAYSKSQRGKAMAGNIVEVQWSARLSEHLGSMQMELLQPVAGLLLTHPQKLTALQSVCLLIETSLPERDPHPRLYDAMKAWVDVLMHTADSASFIVEYIKLEVLLLSELGFGLDLTECAATGGEDQLVYVSPKSGRAVCEAAGEPYKDKLLPLPAFLSTTLDNPPVSSQDIVDGMRLTGYFLEHWVYGPRDRRVPDARGRLANSLVPLAA